MLNIGEVIWREKNEFIIYFYFTASPSMFDESMSPSVLGKSSNDFMASTEHSWINQANAAGSAMGHNPFLIGGKGDSGFISPACQSNNHR